MTAEPVIFDRTLRMAQTLGRQGFRVVRVYEGDKRPVGLDWPRLATADVEELTTQFEPGGVGIGVACGPQPNGINLVVIDVDTKHDGMATWERIVAEHGPFPVTATHRTPSGGLHVFCDSPETIRNGKLAPGIDIRGDGGQVVVPPSWRMINGVQVEYSEAWKASGVHRHYTSALPIAIWEMLQRPTAIEIEASVARHPSQEPLSNPDWLRDHWDWVAVLEAQGHTAVKQVGRDVYMRHPTATAEHSAVVHLEPNMMNAWSTNMPAPLREAQINRDGSIAWSPFDWFTATQHDGNYTAAMTEIYRRRGISGAAPERAEPAPPSINATALPTLPPEFWEHPINAHILAAARARRCGPDALVLNVLLRASMLIPPSFLLPPLAGGFSPINLLGCVVGRTGEGKSVSIAAAADVLTAEHPWLLWDMPLGSGEGVGDVFMMDETEEDERGRKKRTGRRVQNPNLHGVHFTVDEGAALVEQSTRKGATIIPALCKAWTGVTLGETNADVTTRRRVRARSYRVAAVVNIQPTNFHRLFNTLNTGTGLTGRFLFAPAADYEMPDERGDWPGEMDFPELHGSTFGNTLDYHPEIYAEVDAAIVAANRGGGTPENVSHANLLRARVASIYALWADRRTVSPTDWYTAGLLTATSAALLNGLDLQAAQIRRDERHSTAIIKAEVDDIVDDVRDRRAIARMAEAIRLKVADGAMGRNKVARAVSSGSTRYRFDAALRLAISNGWVMVVEDRIEPT